MSTKPASAAPKGEKPLTKPREDGPVVAAIIAASDQPTKTDLSAAHLESALRHEADQRKTERFFWIIGLTIAVDALVSMASAAALAVVIPLELVMLIGLANWLEVDFVKRPLQQILDRALAKRPKDDD